MVEARVGDVVMCGHSFMKPEQIRFSSAKILDSESDEFVQVEHDDGFNWVNGELCTLLHRPILDTDEFIWFHVLGKPDRGSSSFGKHISKHKIHADPALRDHSQYERSDSK
jgi:hypothetical protein